jgi:hypothetical protein
MGTLRLLLVVVAVACTATTAGVVEPDARASTDSAIITEDPGVEWFTGRLATTPTVPFGGAPYCNYSVRLTDLRFDVTMHPTDGLTSIIVADTMNEATVGMCSFPPAPLNRQGFAYLGVPRPPDADGAFTPTLQALPTNSPKTAISTTLTRPTPDTLTSTVRWDRTDQTAPLAWTVTTTNPVSLDRRTCEVGGIYCLGGSGQGLLYSCVDGRHLTRIKVCTPGCVPAEPPRTPHVDEQCN